MPMYSVYIHVSVKSIIHAVYMYIETQTKLAHVAALESFNSASKANVRNQLLLYTKSLELIYKQVLSKGREIGPAGVEISLQGSSGLFFFCFIIDLHTYCSYSYNYIVSNMCISSQPCTFDCVLTEPTWHILGDKERRAITAEGGL